VLTNTDSRTEPRPVPRWRRRKAARPAEILNAALDSFVERGYEASRLDDIARQAGCTKGTIFLYYASKAELFKAAVREAMSPVLLAAEQTVESHRGGARELLEALLRQRWQAMTNTRLSGLPKLMFSEGGKFPELARFYHDEVIERSHALLTRVLELGVEDGEFRPMDAANVARISIAPILLAAVWRHSFATVVEKQIQAEPYFEAALELLFRGIAAPGKES
jgi:AcrR family transcriptional regulator